MTTMATEMTTTPDLKAAALAATPGPWKSIHHGVWADDERAVKICDVSGTTGRYESEQANRDFIALANPASILALLERLQLAEDAVMLLQEIAACSKSDPARGIPTARGKRTTINARKELVDRIEAYLTARRLT